MSEANGDVQVPYLFGQVLNRLAHLPLSFAILADVVNKMNVCFAAAANQRVLSADLAKEWSRVKVTSRAININELTIEIHDWFAVRSILYFAYGLGSSITFLVPAELVSRVGDDGNLLVGQTVKVVDV
jgi:hypothetical protein